jgi:hypothetical protein
MTKKAVSEASRLAAIAAITAAFAAAAPAANAESRAVFADCEEWVGFETVALERVRHHVPARYRLLYEEVGKASLFLRAWRCRSVSVDGGSAHSAVGSAVGVEVHPPDGTGDLNFYWLEGVTNSRQVHAWLAGGAALETRHAGGLAFDWQVPPFPLQSPFRYRAPSPSPSPFTLSGTGGGGSPQILPSGINWWQDTPPGRVKLATPPHRFRLGVGQGAIEVEPGSQLAEILGPGTHELDVVFTDAWDRVSTTKAVVGPSDRAQCAAATPHVVVPECLDHVERARHATRRYQDPAVALREGFVSFECADGADASPPEEGAMGEHWLNPERLDDRIELERPEILLYIPTASGKRLVGVEWLIDKDLSPSGPPRLFGRAFDGPMPGHDALQQTHYDLHAWLWEDNPDGLFDHYNPRLSCEPGGSP